MRKILDLASIEMKLTRELFHVEVTNFYASFGMYIDERPTVPLYKNSNGRIVTITELKQVKLNNKK